MGTQREQMKGVVRWACRAGTRDFCFALTAQIGQAQKQFSPPYTIPIPLSPSPSNPGQAAVLGRLSLSTCLSGDDNYGKQWFLSSLL
jgi:hypothetical protein